MNRLDATRIDYHDVAVIGGGVAGISIAELIARRTDLSVKLIDRAPEFGTGASGRLEGWFHTGALYSAVDDGQTFINCVNSLEDLINLYSDYFGDRCNVGLASGRSGVHVPAYDLDPEADSSGGFDGRAGASGEGSQSSFGDRSCRWFRGSPIYYVQPGLDSPEMRSTRLQNDRVLLEIERQRVFNRLEAAFGQSHDWRGQDGSCRAPLLADIESSEARDCSLRADVPALRELCDRYDRSFDCEPSAYDILKSSDITIDTATVMRDLLASALSRGVDVQPSMAIESLVLDSYGPLRVKSLLCRDSSNRNVHVKAGVFIFAVGAGFDEFLQQLNVRVRVKKHKSSMVVASPALSEVNFARMSMNPQHHFNHMVQAGCAGGREYRYSMIANSSYAEADSDRADEVTSIDHLMDSAERYFGRETLYGRELFGYSCMKTEFLSDVEEKRRYSYWIESDPAANYICVLPGKFSFFPTVAYQTLLRVNAMLDPTESVGAEVFEPNADAVRDAREFVADHYPLRVLSATDG